MEVGAYGGIWVMANGLSGCIEMHVKEGEAITCGGSSDERGNLMAK